MTPERWRQVEKIYLAVLECEPARRHTFLTETCAGDTDLCQEVESLLALNSRAEDFMKMPAAGLVAQAIAQDPALAETLVCASGAGWMIGDYRIVRKLGDGGMGVVYEAEQQHPKRAVALKVIRGGRYVDTHMVKLFEREAQALARLKHPSIAAIYETGCTETGEHFFAMELVRGVPLLEYFEGSSAGGTDAHPGLEARLRVFNRICEAVNYAHQRAVIHRDLKPANILVGAVPVSSPGSGLGNVPELKVLDFGLARITEADVAATTLITEVGRIQGTLAYMSPEQARGNPEEIDLRTDVYSLGMILFELLTGKLPYQIPPKRDPEQIRRIISQEPPRLPPAGGKRRLDRDLGTILLKALEKEPGRRYQSALALAEDIGRYLEKQPVLARPPNTVYQMRKLVQRHKTAFSFAAVLAVLLAGFTVTIIVQSARIVRERDKALAAEKTAKQVSSFLVDLFRVADPTHTGGGTITAREILDRGAAQVRTDLTGQPLLQAQLMDTLGRVYDSLGLYDRAQPLLATALAERRKLLGEDHLDVASSLAANGTFWFHKGEFAEAKPMEVRALAIREKLLSPDDPEVAASLHNLGILHLGMGNYTEAQQFAERALAIREKLPPNHPDLATSVNSLGAITFKKGELAKARQLWERTLAMRESTLTPDHPLLAQTLNNLAVLRIQTGDAAGARPLLERVVRIQEKTLGPNHGDLAFSLSNLGEVLLLSHDYAEAREHYQHAVNILEAGGPNHPELGRFLAGLGRALLETGQAAKARETYQRSLDIREKAFGKNHPETAGSLVGLAMCDEKQRHYQRSAGLFERALALCRRPDGSYKQSAAEFLFDYAVLLRDTGQAARAKEIEALARSVQKGQ